MYSNNNNVIVDIDEHCLYILLCHVHMCLQYDRGLDINNNLSDKKYTSFPVPPQPVTSHCPLAVLYVCHVQGTRSRSDESCDATGVPLIA